MNIMSSSIKRLISKVLIVSLILCINHFAAVVTDSDGSAFITKAEFDSLKNSFQAQIDSYNQAIDSKIDGAIAAYLAGIKISTEATEPFFDGAGSNVCVINSSKVNDMQRGRFALTYNWQSTFFGNATNKGIVNVNCTAIRDNNKVRPFELFNVANGTVKGYIKAGTYRLDATKMCQSWSSWPFVAAWETLDPIGLRWGGGPFGQSTVLEETEGTWSSLWDSYSHRFSDEGYLKFYASGVNVGSNADNTGTGNYSKSISAIKATVSECYFMDAYGGESEIWFSVDDIDTSKIRTNELVNYDVMDMAYNLPSDADVGLSGVVNFAWSAGRRHVSNVVWTDIGNYNNATIMPGGEKSSLPWDELAFKFDKYDTRSLKNNVSDAIIHKYVTSGYSGSISQGIPITTLGSGTEIKFTIDLTTLGENIICAFSDVPFNPSVTLVDNTTLTNAFDVYIDDVKMTQGAKLVNPVEHNFKILSNSESVPVYFMVSWPNAKTTSPRKFFTLPTTIMRRDS